MAKASKGTRRPLVDFCIESENVRLSEAKKDSSAGLAVMEGVAARGNVVNRNNRYYPTRVLRQVAEDLQGTVEEGAFTGELDHPEWNPYGSLDRTAVRFTDLSMEGDDLVFEAVVLDTSAGQTLKSLLEGGVKVGMSTRGIGSVKWEKLNPADDAGEVAVIQDDFKLFGVDAVKVPSNPAGIAKLRESLEESLKRSGHALAEGEEGMEIKTLEELREQFPDLVTAAESAAKTEIQEKLDTANARVTELEAQVATLAGERDEARTKLAEATASAEAVRKAVLGEDAEPAKGEDPSDAVSVAISAMQESIEALQQQIADRDAEIAKHALQGELAAAFEAAVKGHKFEKTLRRSVADLGKFESVAALEARIADVVELAESVAGDVTAPKPGRQPGRGTVEESPETPASNLRGGLDSFLTENQDELLALAGDLKN